MSIRSRTSVSLHPDRLFSVDGSVRSVARALYNEIKNLPIISPHGHTDPCWFAENTSFGNPAALLIQPDHYVFRMLYSQGIRLESLGIPACDSSVEIEVDPRRSWQIFAENYHLFRGTPSRMWMDHALTEVLGVELPLNGDTAEEIFDHINAQLSRHEFLPRSLYERFNIEVLATTESAVDTLNAHQQINQSGWSGRVITTFRPDSVTNPEHPDFLQDMATLAEQTDEEVSDWQGYLSALRKRRLFFKEVGATATDHGFSNTIYHDFIE